MWGPNARNRNQGFGCSVTYFGDWVFVFTYDLLGFWATGPTKVCVGVKAYTFNTSRQHFQEKQVMVSYAGML